MDTIFEADLAAREREVSGGNHCGRDECLPVRQFNREVEIHAARADAVAGWSDGETLRKYYRDFNAALDGLLKVQFGGDR